MDKKLIKLIRKQLPEDMAKAIVGVQPMQGGSVGEIFTMGFSHTTWGEWERRFVFWPKRSLYGKLRWGFVYHREMMNGWRKVKLDRHHADWKEQWANKKEVFKDKLSDG